MRKLRGRDTHVGEPGYCELCDVDMGRGPDACLGLLAGVSHACCGHGWRSQPYVVFGDAPDQGVPMIDGVVTLRGDAALLYFASLGKGPLELATEVDD